MGRKLRLIMLFIVAFGAGRAQTLINYGKYTVDKEEFNRAFNKNNVNVTNRRQAMTEYLELYTRFKLKVRAAFDQKLDTLPAQLQEVYNYRRQLAENFMNSDNSMDALIDEALKRAQTDLRVSQVFIGIAPGANPADTLKAWQTISDALKAIRKGKDFAATSAEYSNDAATRTLGGDLGYLTAFTLPYELENVAYSLKPGEVSNVFRTRFGYHIFKLTDNRRAAGRIRAAQILLAFPPDADTETKRQITRRADSLYNAIKKGSDFGALAREFSNDPTSNFSGGEMPEFGVGRYDASFENMVFGLRNEGDMSPPFTTAFGIHIVKCIRRVPVPADKSNTEYVNGIKQQILNDSRVKMARKAQLNKILNTINYKRWVFDERKLWEMTDSFYASRKTISLPGLTDKNVIWNFPKLQVKVGDWLQYSRAYKTSNMYKGQTYPELLDEYLQATAFEYYRNHLEEYNAQFRYQVQEFKEGNLLFEIMQRQVWDKAAADSAGLQKYYTANKTKYGWEPNAEAIIFTCSDKKTANSLHYALKGNGFNWNALRGEYEGRVQADSGRFELSQLPTPERTNFTDAMLTDIVSYPPDSTTAFAYVIKVHRERSQRSFEEARGFVINDYQTELEDRWIAELKRKYPVKVNKPVLDALMKQ